MTNVEPCANCDKLTHIPDDRTGRIHTNGKYVCDPKAKPKHTTVAE